MAPPLSDKPSTMRSETARSSRTTTSMTRRAAQRRNSPNAASPQRPIAPRLTAATSPPSPPLVTRPVSDTIRTRLTPAATRARTIRTNASGKRAIAKWNPTRSVPISRTPPRPTASAKSLKSYRRRSTSRNPEEIRTRLEDDGLPIELLPNHMIASDQENSPMETKKNEKLL